MNVVARHAKTVPSEYVRTAQIDLCEGISVAPLLKELGDGPFSAIALFVSPEADFATLMAEAARLCPGTEVFGCTTAGEIGAYGYEDGTVLAIGLPAEHFDVRIEMIRALSALDRDAVAQRVLEARLDLAEAAPTRPNGFAMLLVDGLCLREDDLVTTLSPALGGIPLFGGSAGDGVRFGSTMVAHGKEVAEDAAVLALVRTHCGTRVFTLDHLRSTGNRMVVTGADPNRRIVKTINAEPAAREYARIVGKDPDQLDPLTFAAHPVAVRVGGRHHVRAIQRVNSNGELVFFSAIDEGMVLSVAEATDLPSHLALELSTLAQDEAPAAVIGCDCILRRVEAEQRQTTREVSKIMRQHRVVGFSTYGEQYGPLHVNHTMTGVAIYPPPSADLPRRHDDR